MLPNLAGSLPFVLKLTTSWRVSGASETVLGVDNAKSGIPYMYICVGLMVIWSPFGPRPSRMPGPSSGRQSRSSAPTSTSNSRRARCAAQDGRYSKAIQALTSDGLASPSPEILQEMRKKHPQAPPPSVPLDPVPSPAILPEPAVLKGVRSFPNASAPGPSGLRPSHLQEAIRCPSPDCAAQALTTLTSLVNLLAAGRAPPSVLPHLCGATLLASPKKSGGHRPIAVGEVLRRLTSKCLASTSRSSAISSLTPLQLGVESKAAARPSSIPLHICSPPLMTRISAGASSWTSPTPSTALAGSPCLLRSGNASHT